MLWLINDLAWFLHVGFISLWFSYLPWEKGMCFKAANINWERVAYNYNQKAQHSLGIHVKSST